MLCGVPLGSTVLTMVTATSTGTSTPKMFQSSKKVGGAVAYKSKNGAKLSQKYSGIS